jgi:hypothetical protein
MYICIYLCVCIAESILLLGCDETAKEYSCRKMICGCTSFCHEAVLVAKVVAGRYLGTTFKQNNKAPSVHPRTTTCRRNKLLPCCCTAQENQLPPVLPRMSRYPKSLQEQQHYIQLVVDAVRRHYQSGGSLRKSITLLLPDLNPELDIYDRRFLLRLVWDVVALLVLERQQRVKVLVQGPSVSGGGLPLAVAGLLRYLNEDYQLSQESWNGKLATHVSIGTLEECEDGQEDTFVVITPTNAVSTPITERLEQLTQKYTDKSFLLINPSLKDVPSTNGVMQVRGRKERMEFLQTFEDVFYLRPLYKTGTLYPIQGILLRKYPSPWQVWKMYVDDAQGEHYILLEECQHKPDRQTLTRIFSTSPTTTKKSTENNTTREAARPILFFLSFALLLVSLLLVRNQTTAGLSLPSFWPPTL